MTRKEIERYSKAKPLAVIGITNNCGLAILEMQYGIDDYVVVKGFTGDIHRYKLHYNNKGIYFKYCNGLRYYMHQFMKV